MADINIVNENQIGECVANAITDLNDRLWKLKERGFDVEMPEKMDFQMIVVKSGGWQALEVVGTEKGTTNEKGTAIENGKSTEKQGGSTTENQTSDSADTTISSEKGSTDAANSHTQNSTSVQDNYEA
jgi:hypothetical protein